MRATRARLLAPTLILALTALSVSNAGGSMTVRSARQEPSQTAARTAALHAYGALPLAFVPNAGQLDRRVRYAAQAGSASIFLTRRETAVALARGNHGVALRLAFLGANAKPRIAGARQADGRVNYLLGTDPARWHTNLPRYGQIIYSDLWRGVDMRIWGEGGKLKYEFRLAPGADPSRVRLAYRGQERLSLGRDGALRIETTLGVLRDARPVSYQPIGGRRIAVESRFELGRGGAYGFALRKYDSRYPLVIDPGLVYSTFLGGSSPDVGNGIAVDSAGSAYVTGVTLSANYPTTAGTFDRSLDGLQDAFVSKLNAAGSALAYSTFLGGSGSDRGGGIAVDAGGSAYVAGTTSSLDFPTTPDAFDRTYGGQGDDAFVAKLNAAGSGFVYSTYLGGMGFGDWGQAIAVDGLGNGFVTGRAGRDFPTTAGAFDTTYNGSYEAFVTKLNPQGSALVYSSYLGGLSNELGSGIAVDGAGGAYVTGETYSTDFPTTAEGFDTTLNGLDDAFVTKLNTDGSALAYSTFLGGTNYDSANAVAVDGTGSGYVSGRTASADFPTTAGAFDSSMNSSFDAFVAKLNAAGSGLVYSTYLGGTGLRSTNYGYAVAVDQSGSAYVTGSTSATDFPVSPAAFDTSFNGGSDVFAARLNAAGSLLAYSTYLGGSAIDISYGVAVDGAGTAYITGFTESMNFPATAGAFDTSFNGLYDAFVTKLDLPTGSPAPPPPPPPAPRPVRCRVPRVIGMKLPTAKRQIRARHCKTGRVHRVRVRSRLVARVVGQNPRAGKVRARGFRVRLAVGRRR